VAGPLEHLCAIQRGHLPPLPPWLPRATPSLQTRQASIPYKAQSPQQPTNRTNWPARTGANGRAVQVSSASSTANNEALHILGSAGVHQPLNALHPLLPRCAVGIHRHRAPIGNVARKTTGERGVKGTVTRSETDGRGCRCSDSQRACDGLVQSSAFGPSAALVKRPTPTSLFHPQVQQPLSARSVKSSLLEPPGTEQ
jgi:hypothetical protein